MAIDYNPTGYVDENGVESEEKKLIFLLPFATICGKESEPD